MQIVILSYYERKFSWDSKERVVWTLKVLLDLCTNKKKFYKKSNRYRIYLPRQYGFKSEIICTYPITFFHLTEANYWHCVIRLCHKIMTKVVEIMMPRGTYIFWDIYILRYKYSEIYMFWDIYIVEMMMFRGTYIFCLSGTGHGGRLSAQGTSLYDMSR